MSRVGFFGGSFDPPHCGHLALARRALETFQLERILFAPTGVQPLKPDGPCASFDDRCAMVEAACVQHPTFQLSLLDAPRPDGTANYTVDALDRLRSTLTAGDSIFVLAGIDAFLDLRRWRDPDRLLALAEWIVVSRPAMVASADTSAAQLASLGLTAAQADRIHLLRGVAEPASSTAIRSALRAGKDCSSLLPAPVMHYIHAHRLYGA